MELVGLHVYALVWSILLGSPGIHGLSLYKRDGFPETNGEMDKNVTDSASTSKPYTVTSLNTSLTTPGNGQDNHTSSLYVSLSKDPTTLDGLHGKERNVTAGRGPSQNDTTRDTLELNPVVKGNPPVEYGILTVSMSTADDITGVTSPFRNTTEPNQTEDGTNTTIKDGNNLSKVNTVEMLTTNPRTSVLKAGDDQPTTTAISVDPAATSNPETTFKGDAVLGITSVMLTSSRITEVSETSWRSSGDINKMDFPFTAESDEWDDTKITTPLPMNITTQSDIITSHKTTTLTTGVGAEVRASLPLSTDSHAATGTSEEVFSIPHVDISMDHLARNMSSPVQVLADTELDPTTSQNPGSPSSYAGVTLQMSDVTDTTVTTAILTDAAPEKTTGEFNGSDQPGEPVTDVLLPSTTAEETPEAGKAVTPGPTSSQMNVMFPPAIRVAAAAGDVLEKHDSEEGDEEDDEEEDDDEDEEEEEDDDKYTDSVNESVEGDSDLPPFTLPGLVSQESLEDKSNVVLMDGASYQVPDTQEWEQQNQGLVRSWMEKLKGKAGYMSGMLAPVGVGIGGALTILAVLYSVKIINRRRRNGFKQHKRKPREFSGMQDRVMLLADSSEDEF